MLMELDLLNVANLCRAASESGLGLSLFACFALEELGVLWKIITLQYSKLSHYSYDFTVRMINYCLQSTKKQSYG